GRVYSCTTLHAAAEPFEKDLPFQIAIVELEEGARLTARIRGAAVDVDGVVRWVEERDGVHFFSGA
ncbi:MAG: OB-fold domain-containing protein, partial [Acidobacteria bacterium]|nr:OB-fold domain-containing protein [Acidobacteriota bacterium]